MSSTQRVHSPGGLFSSTEFAVTHGTGDPKDRLDVRSEQRLSQRIADRYQLDEYMARRRMTLIEFCKLVGFTLESIPKDTLESLLLKFMERQRGE